LSYAKLGKNNQRLPGEHLNSVLIDMAKGDLPNKPRRVRNKRIRKTEMESNSDSSSENEQDLYIPIDDIFTKKQKTQGKRETENDYCGADISESKDLSTKSTSEKTDDSENEVLDQPFIENFKSHVPVWSAYISYKDKADVYVSNTCTIDYFLLAYWVLNKIKPHYIDSIADLELKNRITKIIEKIDLFDWNMAREEWIVGVMKYDKSPIANTISMWGSVHDRFAKYVIGLQTYSLRQLCDTDCMYSNQIISSERQIMMFEKTKKGVQLHTFQSKLCKQCKKKAEWKFEFKNEPKILFIESADNTTFNEIPDTLMLNSFRFRILCSMLHMPNHFVGIFRLKNASFVVDDLEKNAIFLPPFSAINKSRRNSLNTYYSASTSITMYYNY
jgi:hypothetical protein